MDQGYLNECLAYSPLDGSLVWRTRPREHFDSHLSWKMFNGKYAGCEAGSIFKCSGGISYKRLKINGDNLLCHRVIWVMVHGEIPDQIDHINGDGMDNRIANLRSVDSFGNMKNRAVSTANTAGLMGVYWYKRNKKWAARIGHDCENEYLGLFPDYFEACCARKSAELRYDFHDNHGRKPEPIEQ